jgi:hypothetical protein
LQFPAGKPTPKLARVTPAPGSKGKKHINQTLAALEGISMRDWLRRDDLFGPFMLADSWFGWFVLLVAFVGEPLITDRELAKYRELTGLDYRPGVPLDELWVAASRRTGKTAAISILASFFILTKDYSAKLRPGERPLCVLIAKDMSGATELLSYIKGYFDEIPLFHGLIEGETATSLRLCNRVQVQVKAGSFRSIRGHSIVFCANDEICFWQSEGANPAEEVLSAIRPSLLSLGGKLVSISSVYGKFGPMYENYKKYSDGHDPKITFVKANTFALNPSITQEQLDREKARDPLKFSREWANEFEEGLQQFIDREVVERLVVAGRVELAPREGVEYRCFVDPAGGHSDEYAVCIAHTEYVGDTRDIEHQRIVIDVLRGERGRPDDITVRYAQIMKAYRITECTGDAYAGDWPMNAFERQGITYVKSERHKSDIYAECLPVLRQGRCELLDDRHMVAQFSQLEVRTSRVGRDTISHPVLPGATDDRANCCSGAIVLWSGEEINEGAEYLKWLCTDRGRQANDEQLLRLSARYGLTVFPAH